MLNDNPLLQQLKQQMRQEVPQVEGVVRATDRGFGFLDVDSDTSYFIAPPMMRRVLHGDRISALLREVNGRTQAEPEKLLDVGMTRFIARIERHKGQMYLQIDHPFINLRISAKPNKAQSEVSWNEGDWVEGQLIRHALRDKQFFAHITQKIADASDPFAPWKVTLVRHELSTDAPVLNGDVGYSDSCERIDLCDLPFVTIDGESTLDMDDALHIATLDSGWRLTVAIADPSAVVQPGSVLDAEAKDRGYTLYLPGQNIPMLPRELSEQCCSLHQDQRRPALCCRIDFNPDGSIQGEPEFFNAWICSTARLNYDRVSDYIEQGIDAEQFGSEVCTQLTLLDACTQARFTWRSQHQCVFADRPDYFFELDAQGEVQCVHTKRRRLAHRIVEEAMIVANTVAGEFFARRNQQAFFNTHTGLISEQKEALATLLEEQDVPLNLEQLQHADALAKLRRYLIAHPNTYLELSLRRLQALAQVELDAAPHQAMGVSSYATWTSPIRKYSDLINQRRIKDLIADRQPSPIEPALVEHLAQRRRVHRFAEREICERLYRRYLTSHFEQPTQFAAQIIEINRSGLRVLLEDLGAMAFIPGQNICKEHPKLTLSRESGRVLHDEQVLLQLGDRLQVQLKKSDAQGRSMLAKLCPMLELSAKHETTPATNCASE